MARFLPRSDTYKTNYRGLDHADLGARCAALAFEFARRENSRMAHQFSTPYLQDAMGVFTTLDEGSDSISIIVKRVAR